MSRFRAVQALAFILVLCFVCWAAEVQADTAKSNYIAVENSSLEFLDTRLLLPVDVETEIWNGELFIILKTDGTVVVSQQHAAFLGWTDATGMALLTASDGTMLKVSNNGISVHIIQWADTAAPNDLDFPHSADINGCLDGLLVGADGDMVRDFCVASLSPALNLTFTSGTRGQVQPHGSVDSGTPAPQLLLPDCAVMAITGQRSVDGTLDNGLILFNEPEAS